MPRPLLVWSPELLEYDFGPGHPMSPLRLRLAVALLESFGIDAHFDVVAPEVAGDAALATVHDAEYIGRVRSGDDGGPPYRWGLNNTDNPWFGDMHIASARIVGGTVAAARAVWRGAAPRAVNLAGGMHHAMHASAAGFCVYNDGAAGIAAMLAEGAERVLYLDVDAHHGDGVERAFWDDPRVVTVSIHQSGRTLFPGTGFSQDSGGPGALGTAVNVPVPAGTCDAAWLRALDAIAGPIVEHWRPQVILSQHGADAHARDALTDLDISVDAQRAAAVMVKGWADDVAQGRWVGTGGGGYDLISVVPRVWTHLAAIAADHPIAPDEPTPAVWREQVEALVGRPGPSTMGEGKPATFTSWGCGYNPEDPVDRVVMATRTAVFPELGIDPEIA